MVAPAETLVCLPTPQDRQVLLRQGRWQRLFSVLLYQEQRRQAGWQAGRADKGRGMCEARGRETHEVEKKGRKVAISQLTQAVAAPLGAVPALQAEQAAEALRGATVPEGQALQTLEGSPPEAR